MNVSQQKEVTNNYVGEMNSQDLYYTEGVDPLAFFAASALEAASSQSEFTDSFTAAASKKRKRSKKGNSKSSTSEIKKKKKRNSPTKAKKIQDKGNLNISKKKSVPLILIEEKPDETKFTLQGNTTSLFRNPVHSNNHNEDNNNNTKNKKSSKESDSLNNNSNSNKVKIPERWENYDEYIPDRARRQRINATKRVTEFVDCNKIDHELPKALRIYNDNFTSIADGIGLRGRHIHNLPMSNKAMPRKRENQRYLLGLGYLSREFYSYLLSKKDGRGDIIDFANIQGVSRRRVYDIVCAMEGGGICYAEKKHVVGWKPKNKRESISNARKCFTLRNQIKDLKQEEAALDIGIQRMESLIRNTYKRQGKLHYILGNQLQRAIRNSLVDDENDSTGAIKDGKKRSILLINANPSQVIEKVTNTKDRKYQLNFRNIKKASVKKSVSSETKKDDKEEKVENVEQSSTTLVGSDQHLRIFNVTFNAKEEGIKKLVEKKKKMGASSPLQVIDTYNLNDNYDTVFDHFKIQKSDIYDSNTAKRRQALSRKATISTSVDTDIQVAPSPSPKRIKQQGEHPSGGGVVIKKRMYRRSRSIIKKIEEEKGSNNDIDLSMGNNDNDDDDDNNGHVDNNMNTDVSRTASINSNFSTSLSRTSSYSGVSQNNSLSRSTSLNNYLYPGDVDSQNFSQQQFVAEAFGGGLPPHLLHSQTEDLESSPPEDNFPIRTLSQKVLVDEVGSPNAHNSGVTLANSAHMIFQLSQDVNSSNTTSLPTL